MRSRYSASLLRRFPLQAILAVGIALGTVVLPGRQSVAVAQALPGVNISASYCSYYEAMGINPWYCQPQVWFPPSTGPLPSGGSGSPPTGGGGGGTGSTNPKNPHCATAEDGANKGFIQTNEGPDPLVATLTQHYYGKTYTNETGFVPPCGFNTPCVNSGLTFLGFDASQFSYQQATYIVNGDTQLLNELAPFLGAGLNACFSTTVTVPYNTQSLVPPGTQVPISRCTQYGPTGTEAQATQAVFPPNLTASQVGVLFSGAYNYWYGRVNAASNFVYMTLPSDVQTAIMDSAFAIGLNSQLTQDLSFQDWLNFADDLFATGNARLQFNAITIELAIGLKEIPAQGNPCS